MLREMTVRERIGLVLVFAAILMRSTLFIDPGISLKFLFGYVGVFLLLGDLSLISRKVIKFSILFIALFIGWNFIQWLVLPQNNIILQSSKLFSLLFLPLGAIAIGVIVRKYGLNGVFSLLNLVLLAVLVYALGYVVVVLGNLNELNSYGLNSFFEHRNILGAFVMLAITILWFCFVRISGKLSSIQKYIFWFNWGLSIFIIVNLHSRASWISLFLLFITLVIFYVRKQIVMKKLMVVSLIFSGLSFGYLWLSASPIEDSNAESIENHAAKQSISDRVVFWNKSVEMIMDHPVLGVGGGQWMLFAGKDGWQDTSLDNGVTFVQRPHNEWLSLPSEFGLIGLLLIIILPVMIIRLCYLHRKENGILLLTLASILFMLYMSVSFPFERYELLVLLAFIFGFLFSFHDQTIDDTSKYIKWIKGVVIFGMISFSTNLYTDYLSKQVVDAKTNNYLMDHQDDIEKLLELGYYYDRLGIPLKWYLGTIYLQDQRFEESRELMNESLAISPYLSLVLNDLAVSKMMLKDDSAEKDFNTCLEYTPSFQEALFNLSTFYYFSQQYEDAAYQLNKVTSPKLTKQKEELINLIENKIK